MLQPGPRIRQRERLRPESGFTVIELAAVLVATGLLTTIAYVAYETFTVRSEIVASIRATQAVQTEIADVYRRAQRLADNKTTLNSVAAAETNRYIDVLQVEQGRIDIRYGKQANAAIAGRVLSLTPYENASIEISWICGNSIPSVGLKPLGFASGGPQAVQIPTTVEQRYLPRDCL